MKRFIIFALITIGITSPTTGQEIKIDAPETWRKETIKLPPEFAPDMKLKGIEELRFSPSMFASDSESFFSYVFVFKTEPEPALTESIIKQEMLAYYCGLSSEVLKGKKVDIDTSNFTFSMNKLDQGSRQSSLRPGVQRYVAKLKWIEPFVTEKTQDLRLEIDTWSDGNTKQQYLFACVSPADKKEKIWEQMFEIRSSFYESLK